MCNYNGYYNGYNMDIPAYYPVNNTSLYGYSLLPGSHPVNFVLYLLRVHNTISRYLVHLVRIVYSPVINTSCTGTVLSPVINASCTGTVYSPVINTYSTGTVYSLVMNTSCTVTVYSPVINTSSTGTVFSPVINTSCTGTVFSPVINTSCTGTSYCPPCISCFFIPKIS